ncbi:hypothetical protein [Solimonas variicoloris]|uniref:hypothetical protein n=1 Tax=Solimonas variicoloris TaxID=254408 RepID=UPI0012B62086|nr:hypothetical protein [Solimonas variicoloris]
MKKIPKDKIHSEPEIKLSDIESKVLGVSPHKSKNVEVPYIALKYYDYGWQCLSAWEKDELKAFSSFSEKLGQVTWQKIFESGGSLGKKTGFGYTKLDEAKIAQSAATHIKKVKDKISADINIFELRVSGDMRVVGFRAKETFFLVLLDRAHAVCP